MINIKQFKMYKLFSILYDILIIIAVMSLCLIILFFSNTISLGVLNGIKTCVNILIPSLLPFMILSSFIIQSGLAEKIGTFISPITKLLFNLPGATGATIVFSFIGGYPVGANGIESLLQKNIINKKQAIRMLTFCVGAGPAFIINVVGDSLLKNKSIGIIILISQIIASILIGIFLGIYSKFKNDHINESKTTKINKDNILNAFVQSCLSSFNSLMNMCIFVVIFSAIISLLYNTSIYNIIMNVCSKTHLPFKYCICSIPIILEVTTGCIQSVNNLLPIEILNLAISWAGICVHFQILSSVKSLYIPYHKFVFQRLLHSIISTIICHYILSIYQFQQSVFSNIQISPQPSMSSNLSVCVNLILLCIIFIITLILKSEVRVKN